MLWSLILNISLSFGCHGNSDLCPPTPCLFQSECDGCLLPINPFVFYGENLTLDCHLETSNLSDSLYVFWKNDVNISRDYYRVTSPNTLHINRPITEQDGLEEGTMVACVKPKLSDTDSPAVYSQYLEVDYFPHKVNDWSAIVNDWADLTLTWDPGKYVYPENVSVNVTWAELNSDIWQSCSHMTWQPASRTASCYLNTSIYTHPPQLTFSFILTYSLDYRHDEVVLSSVTVDTHKHVKPSPVQSLVVMNVTSTSVSLHWHHDMHGRHQLIYDVITQSRNITLSNISTERTSTTITGLHPYTDYSVSVTVRSVLGGFPSHSVTLNTSTLEDKPAYGPNITAGSFMSGECLKNKRNVTIFVKPPDAEYQNGKLISYNIRVKPSDSNNYTQFSQSAESYAVVAKGLNCDMNYDVYISIETSVGASNETHLYIPKHGLVTPATKVRVGVNSSTVSVSWQSQHELFPLSATVFWCEGNSSTCTSGLSWLTVAGSARTATVPVRGDVVDGYQFAVSMTTQAGSSGMVFQECIYNVDRVPDHRPIIQTVESVPSLALTVTWSLPVCQAGVLVSHYTVQHCNNVSTPHCVAESVSGDRSCHVISHLQAGAPYSVRLRQQTVAGMTGEFSDPKIGTPVGDNNRLTGGPIAGIVLACILLCVLLILIARISCSKWRERESIKMPRDFQDYLREHIMSPTLPERPVFTHKQFQTDMDDSGVEQDRSQTSTHDTMSTHDSRRAPPSQVPPLSDGVSVMDSALTDVTILTSDCTDVTILTSDCTDVTILSVNNQRVAFSEKSSDTSQGRDCGMTAKGAAKLRKDEPLKRDLSVLTKSSDNHVNPCSPYVIASSALPQSGYVTSAALPTEKSIGEKSKDSTRPFVNPCSPYVVASSVLPQSLNVTSAAIPSQKSIGEKSNDRPVPNTCSPYVIASSVLSQGVFQTLSPQEDQQV